MIQRIQTIYLLIAVGLEAILAKVAVLKWTGDTGFTISEKLMKYFSFHFNRYTFSGGYILMGVVIALWLGAVMSYKNRKSQMRLALAGVLVNIVLWGKMLYNVITYPSSTAHLNFFQSPGIYLPILANVFAVLAYLAVKKDEELVKSLDRIR